MAAKAVDNNYADVRRLVSEAKRFATEAAWDVVNRCFLKGLLMFAPVGLGGGCVKIAPPLCISEDALREGCDVIYEAVKESI